MHVQELNNKRVLVAGLGITGLSVARFLTAEGVTFEVADESLSDGPLPVELHGVAIHGQFDAALFCSVDVIILSPGVPRAHPAIKAALGAGVRVIGDIELFAGAVSVPVIAVTGSNGKSTVVAWLSHTLNACKLKAIACGNIGDPALDALRCDADVLVLEGPVAKVGASWHNAVSSR